MAFRESRRQNFKVTKMMLPLESVSQHSMSTLYTSLLMILSLENMMMAVLVRNVVIDYVLFSLTVI